MSWIWLVYGAGVLVGLVLADGRLVTRVSLALLWPLGPAAFVVTVAILVLAAMIAFPLFGLLVTAAAGAAWLLLS
jgi:hypothetical protein